ncbi:hypothetical protein VUR80DRAFT_7827 [Thermomyces stellatus]
MGWRSVCSSPWAPACFLLICSRNILVEEGTTSSLASFCLCNAEAVPGKPAASACTNLRLMASCSFDGPDTRPRNGRVASRGTIRDGRPWLWIGRERKAAERKPGLVCTVPVAVEEAQVLSPLRSYFRAPGSFVAMTLPSAPHSRRCIRHSINIIRV